MLPRFFALTDFVQTCLLKGPVVQGLHGLRFDPTGDQWTLFFYRTSWKIISDSGQPDAWPFRLQGLYLVGGLVAIFYFPIYWVSNHPNWQTHIFQRGGPTTNQLSFLFFGKGESEIWTAPLLRGLRGRFKSPPLEAFRGPCWAACLSKIRILVVKCIYTYICIYTL